MVRYLGVYIHIPFCAKKCAYCDFYSLSGKGQLMPRYQKALLTHIKESSSQLEDYFIDTVYFGGGTPSFYGANRLVDILDALKKNGRLMVDSEVTVEVNPDSASFEELLKLRRAGFNRISIGVQSTDDETLKKIGRVHDYAAAVKAVDSARRAGFKNISIDLIFGLPGQTRESWAENLSKAITLKPDHISCYGLKLAEGTEMYILKDSPFLPDDDTQADMYLYTVEYLREHGYRQYEISNFARTGYESAHNLKYWTGQEYLGFGAAAHSYIGSRRFGNLADIDGYIRSVQDGSPLVEQVEVIGAFERASEYLMLGLRTTRGINGEEYHRLYPSDFSGIEARLQTCEQYGWAEFEEGRWRFTPKGFLISNVLIGQILDAQKRRGTEDPDDWRPEAVAADIDSVVVLSDRGDANALFHGI